MKDYLEDLNTKRLSGGKVEESSSTTPLGTRRGCCELNLVALPIGICQLAWQLDQVQKNLLKYLSFHHHFSYYVVLHF